MTRARFQFSPGEFKVKEADLEQTLERFELYLEAMQKVFRLNRRVNPTTGAKVEFDNQDKKDIIQLEGGLDMVDLFKHVGKVLDGDTYDVVMEKIRQALKGRGNRTAAVFKLFTGMAQGERTCNAIFIFFIIFNQSFCHFLTFKRRNFIRFSCIQTKVALSFFL